MLSSYCGLGLKAARSGLKETRRGGAPRLRPVATQKLNCEDWPQQAGSSQSQSQRMNQANLLSFRGVDSGSFSRSKRLIYEEGWSVGGNNARLHNYYI